MAIFNTIITGGAMPASGTVTDLPALRSLTADKLGRFAKMISDNSGITNDTEAVAVYDGNVWYVLRVGDELDISLDGTAYAFLILGFNHDSLETADAYGAATATGKAGITLQMKDCFGTAMQIGSSSTRLWDGCELRSTLRADFMAMLPEEWQGLVKPVIKSTAYYWEGGPVTESTDTLFLPDETEVFGCASNSNPIENSQYAWYKAGGSTIKCIGETETNWWLRSQKTNSSWEYCCVSTSGMTSYKSNSVNLGVAFAFCI